jgi:assimilatory nitrate reductase catalytic subunit
LRRRAIAAPPGVRSDIEIMCQLARRMGHQERFLYQDTEAVFNELRRATAGARADYSGMTYERLGRDHGMFWPCPDTSHPGTPRLFSERFYFEDGKARFYSVPYRAAGELPDQHYPLYFTTGRYKEHYNSGAQTRRVDKLTEAKGEPKLQIHPRLAERLQIGEGSQVLVESRRGRVVFRATLSVDIRPDTLFAPFHWGGRQAANVLTNPALDPTSRMPEFKVCAVRARRIDGSSELVELFSDPPSPSFLRSSAEQPRASTDTKGKADA